MGWQPKTKQKRKCPRCGQSFYVLDFGGGPAGGAGFLIDGTECPKCRKLRGNLLTRAGRNQRPPGAGK